MVSFAVVKDYLEVVSYLTVIVSLPLALYQYRKITTKEQADREYGTYNALDEKYLEFLKLCYDSPGLDIFDVADSTPLPVAEIDYKRELIAFTMLFSVFERAYLMYYDQPDKIRARQWTGWLDYIQHYCSRGNFRKAWEVSGETFDTGFQVFMSRELERCTVTSQQAATQA